MIRRAVKKLVLKMGYEINRVDWTYNPRSVEFKIKLYEQTYATARRHWQQTKETVLFLKQKYEKPLFGKVHILDMFHLLAQCISPADIALGTVSQLTHVLQAAESMEEDGIKDPDFIMAGLIHDLGKVLLLTDEKPENIIGGNKPIGEHEEGIGLDNCLFTWNHDEFIYTRLKNYLPYHMSWLIRYHGILIPDCERYMNKRDRELCEKYLVRFQKYDKETKCLYRIPQKGLAGYKDMILSYFPKPIDF